MILDDFDARPGSATSLLRTIVGVGLRRVGGWISIADLIRLMDAVGVTPAHTRTAVSRVKAKGLLVSSTIDGRPGYALNPDAIPMLERGDRRIFTFRQMADGDPWCLLSFSIPEAQRDVRHQLRKRLGWIGCGVVATGLWICPAFLADEVEEIVADLGLAECVALFITGTPRIAGSLADAARRWWDLDGLKALHRRLSHGAVRRRRASMTVRIPAPPSPASSAPLTSGASCPTSTRACRRARSRMTGPASTASPCSSASPRACGGCVRVSSRSAE